MSNFLGFGFNMAARDVGMEAAMTSAEQHLESLNGLIDEQNEKKPGIWQKMREGVKRFNIASIASNVRDLNGETGRLTNNLESMGVANAQAVKPLVAQMDLTAQEAKKMTSRISGMAIGMNVGATEVADVFKAIQQAGPPAKAVIDELGLSQRDWVKITTTSGISMAELTGVMGDLTGEWQVAPERAAGMLDSLVEIGKRTGTGIAALKTATQTVGEFGDIQARLPAHLRVSGDAIAQATEQAYKLAGAYRDMGANEEQAVELGKDTAKMFMEQSTALKLARVGLGDIEDASLYNKLRQMGVNEAKVMEILAEGEKDAVKGMMMLNEEMRKAAGSSEMHKIMMGQLSQTLGETGSSLVYLAESADVGSESLAKMDALTVQGKGNLKKFGDQAFSSGRTLQESLDFAKESFETRLRKIGRGPVRSFVRDQVQAYKRVGDQLVELGGDSTWGPIIEKISIFDQMGSKGVFKAFSKDLGLSTEKADEMSVMLEYAMGAAGRVAEEFEPIMSLLGTLGPLGSIGVAGGVAAFFLLDESDRKEIFGSFYPIIEQATSAIEDLWNQIDWEPIKRGAEDALEKVGDFLGRQLEKAFSALLEFIQKHSPQMASFFGITDALDAIKEEKAVAREVAAIRKKMSGQEALGQTVIPEEWEGDGWVGSGQTVDVEQSVRARRAAVRESRSVLEMQRMIPVAQRDIESRGWSPAMAEQGARVMASRASVATESMRGLAGIDSPVISKMAQDSVFSGILPEGIVQRWASAQALTGLSMTMGDAEIKKLGEVMSETFSEPIKRTKEGWAEAAEASLAGGEETMYGFAAGAASAEGQTLEALDMTMVPVAETFGGSLPTRGPLADGMAAEGGGLYTMYAFADGLIMGVDVVRGAVSSVLDEAVIGTMEEYQAKAEQVASVSGILEGVAKSIVESMGGKIDMGTVEVDGEVIKSGEQLLRTSLSMPGLAGVTAAVISNGQETRKILSAIRKDTKAMSEAPIMQKNVKFKTDGGDVSVVPG